jgi:hypothetical protein
MPRIDFLDDALLVPATTLVRDPPRRPGGQGRGVFDGGVYSAAGLPLDLARHVGGNTGNVPAPRPPSGPAPRLAGTWLFGGWLRQHFGHFFNESLGRLWAWPELPEPPRGVIFLPLGWQSAKHAPHLASGPADQLWLPEILRLLDLTPKPEIRLVTAPQRVARLVVPQQLSLQETPEEPQAPQLLRTFLRRAGRGGGTPSGRAYLSRSHLPQGRASFVLESWLDANFARAGYRVIHPETLSLAAQIEAYRGLEMVVCAEGSAIHLAVLYLPDTARIGMIWRLGSRHTPIFRQLQAAGFQAPAEFTAISGLVASLNPGLSTPGPELQGVVWRQAHAVPDFAALGRQLVEAGFLPPGADWPVPGPTEVAAAIEADLAALSGAAPSQAHLFLPATRLPHAAKSQRPTA